MKRTGKVIGSLVAAGVAFSCGYLMKAVKRENKEEVSSSAELSRLNVCYDMLTKWMSNDKEGVLIGDYLKKQEIYTVGIYGHGKVGILLYQTLKEQGISIKYFSDIMTTRKGKGVDGVDQIPIVDMKDIPVDAIIITPCWDKEDIVSSVQNLLKKSSFHVKGILPLNELLYDM